MHALASHGWVPDQHGAWPMATVPILVGAVASGFVWRHVLLLCAWVAGFLFFNAAGLWLRSPRRSRYAPAVRLWLAVSAVLGAATVLSAPHLLRWGPVFAPLVLVAFWEAARGRERSLASRLATVVACGLTCAPAHDLSPATTHVPGWWPWRDAVGQVDPATGWTHAWILTALLTAYLVGTVPHVRCLIRGRGDARWIAGSVAWHAAGVAGAVAATAAGATSWAVPAVWALLLARAAAMPWGQSRRGPWAPKTIGVTEMVMCAAVAASLLLPPA